MKCILFDLDGTLLPLDNNVFTKGYFSLLTKYCSSKIQPDIFMKCLMSGTKEMIANKGEMTNEEIFKKVFLEGLNLKEDEIFPHLEEFYRTDYHSLVECTKPTELARKLIQAACDKGYGIVLATNALFPLDAIKTRMKWANILDFPWIGITDYASTIGGKPNVRYYEHIINKHDIDANGSWMVGNDAYEDMIAKEVGFSTYLVTDCKIDKEGNMYKPDRSGNLYDCLQFLETELADA